jgi:hypothetical protein
MREAVPSQVDGRGLQPLRNLGQDHVMRTSTSALLLVTLFGSVACSSVVVPDDSFGGAGGTSTGVPDTSSPSSTQTGSTQTGTTGCAAHEQCPDGLCIFATGQCAQPCEPGGFCQCGPGTVCDGCATSSCPGCRDCAAACVPVTDGQCSDGSECKDGSACFFERSTCLPLCREGKCDDPSMICKECATGSCCGCNDCVDLCIPLD